jgi:transposase
MLLPASVDDYVGAGNAVRAIDAFVDYLDLSEAGFARTKPADTGRPPFNPADLLKLYLWGYLNRVHSSRRLENECRRNLEVLWLLKTLAPDFKTISDFRKDNRDALKAVFRQFVVLCKELGLLGGELIAIDGTKLKASNNVSHQRTAESLAKSLAEIEARIEEFLALSEKSDTDLLGEECPNPNVEGLDKKLAALRRQKERCAQALEVAQATGAKAPTIDPECQSMQKVGCGYNAQIAVDAKNHLIVAAEISEKPTDHAQLPVVAEVASEVLQKAGLKVVADAGYHDRSALAEAEHAGFETYVPRPKAGHAATEGVFHKSEFTYEAEEDAYRCPAGKLLGRTGCYEKHKEITFAYANPSACKGCPLKGKCAKGPYRRIERWEEENVLEQLEDRVARHPEIIKKRKALVEHPFGTIKFWRCQGALLTRGRRGARAELSLSAMAYNLTRLLALLGVAGLVKALQALQARSKAGVGAVNSCIKPFLAAWSRLFSSSTSQWERMSRFFQLFTSIS